MISFPKIDVHTHIYPQKIRQKAVASVGNYYNLPMHGEGSAEEMIEDGSRINVVKYVIHGVATVPAQIENINNFTAQMQREYPCIIGYGTLHPLMNDPAGEIARMQELGLRGVKFHPEFQNFDLASPEAYKLYELLEGVYPIMVHMGDENSVFSHPERMSRIISDFPGLKVIASHFGGYSAWGESRKYLIGRNVWMDTSSALFKLAPEEAAEMIREHGSKRFFFGSDYPMWMHEAEYERFMRLPLTDKERRDIFYNNAAAFFGV